MPIITAVIFGLLAVQAEKVTLAWSPKQGDKLKSTQRMEMTISAKVVANGQTQKFEVGNRHLEIQTYEVAEVTDGKLRKLVMDIEKDVEEQKQPGMEDFEKKEGPLQGRRITITDKAGKLQFEGAEGLDEKAMKKLDLEPDKFAKTFPANPVAVGDTWEVAGDKAREIFGKGDQDLKDGKITCTLKEVKEIDGKRCAVLDAKVEMGGKSGEGVDMAISMSGEIIVLVDRGYSMSVRLKGKVTMSAENEQMTMKGEGSMTVEVTAALK